MVSSSGSSISKYIFCKVKVSKSSTLTSDTHDYLIDNGTKWYAYAGFSNELHLTGSISSSNVSVSCSSTGFTKYGGVDGRPYNYTTGKYFREYYPVGNEHYYYYNSVKFESKSYSFTGYRITFTKIEYFAGDSTTAYSDMVDSDDYAYPLVFTLPTL